MQLSLQAQLTICIIKIMMLQITSKPNRIWFYYVTSSLSRQDEPNVTLWLATQAGKMELCCLLGIQALSRKENMFLLANWRSIFTILSTRLKFLREKKKKKTFWTKSALEGLQET